MNHKNIISPWIVIPWLIFPDLIIRLAFEGRLRSTIVSLVFIFIFVVYLKQKHFRLIAFSKPMLIWIILTIFHLINAYLQHVPDMEIPEYLQGFRIYASICIFAFLYSIDGEKTIRAFYWSLGVWLVIAVMDVGITIGHRMTGKDVIAVEFGRYAALMAIAGIYLSMIRRESLGCVFIRIAFPLLIIILSQSRNAFGMIVIMLIGYYYSIVMKAKISLKSVVPFFIFMTILILGIKTVVDASSFGERIKTEIEYTESEIRGEDYSTGTVFDYVGGERMIYYIKGWEIFTEHPIVGIGLRNYQYYVNGIYPMHVEYMVHLAEGGIVAFILWISFLFSLFMIIKKSNMESSERSIANVTMFAMLFTCMYSVVYLNELAVSPFGIILSMKYASPHGLFHKMSI